MTRRPARPRQGASEARRRPRPRALFLAAEAGPLVKVGGLADVAGALPLALRRLGVDVRLALPLHPSLRKRVARLSPRARFQVDALSGPQVAAVYEWTLGGMPVYLVDGPPLQRAEAVYSASPEQDAPKLVFFSIAALHFVVQQGWTPDLVHANDWHTAGALYWMRTSEPGRKWLGRAASLLTIHNLPYTGDGSETAMREYGLALPGDLGMPAMEPALAAAQLPEWARDALLPLGILAADRIVAVSPTYSVEIQTPEFGSGLEALLRARSEVLTGILNGLDLKRWNPSTDRHLVSRYSRARLSRRRPNKEALRRALGLSPEGDAPLVGIVSRLDPQKGLDLALAPLEGWARDGGQVALLGAGSAELETVYRGLEARHPGRVGVRLGYHDELASLIYAGSDLFLMPSRYEPCGLSQMIAMRYGALPVARATGGLRDTIRDASQPGGTGFLFGPASPAAIVEAMGRARELLASAVARAAVQQRAMSQDFGWDRSAREYLKAYRRAIRDRAHEVRLDKEGR